VRARLELALDQRREQHLLLLLADLIEEARTFDFDALEHAPLEVLAHDGGEVAHPLTE